MQPDHPVRRTDGADPDAVAAAVALVDRVVAAATTADGAAPLDEAARLALHRAGGLRAGTLLTVADAAGDGPAGFAWRHPSPGGGGTQVDLAVHPAARGRGLGAALARAVLDDADAGAPVDAWAHGNHPAAAALARRLGLARVRELWVMRRPLSDLPPLSAPPPEVSVRAFEPGRDEEALLGVNAAAFAEHPEQGALSRAGLAERMAQDWFDPAGLFLAEEDGRLLGFHWTKVHRTGLEAHESPHGEVYVLGIAPEAQGRGLGRLLTLTGLHHLAGRGLAEVLLYVEADNAAALATYTGLGFTHAAADTHVLYRRAPRGR